MKQIRHERRLTHIPAFWDALIVLLILIGASAAIGSWTWMILLPESDVRIHIALGIFGLLGCIGLLLTFWGSFIEPKLIAVNTKSIHSKALPELTIAVIADFHVGPYKGTKYVERIVRKANALQPDLILLPGDFIFDCHASLSHLEPLKNLCARLGVFAVLGNHDTGNMLLRTKKKFVSYRTPDRSKEIIATLERLGITVLRNTNKMMTIGDRAFAIAGSDHCWMESCDPVKTFSNIPADVPVILLAHIPDAIMDGQSTRASLIVSGHTHGGQVRLPWIGSVYPIPDQLGRAYDQGLFRLQNGTILAITHGIGETMARARLFCPPEILLLKIKG